MSGAILLACVTYVLLLVLQVSTCVVVVIRVRRKSPPPPPAVPVTIVVSVAGLDEEEASTALSAMPLAGPDVHVLYCAFDEGEPAVQVIRRHLVRAPVEHVRILTGRMRRSRNPKIDNIEKALAEVRTDYVAFVDGNLRMPADFVPRLLAEWHATTGAVSSPPLAVEPLGFWADVECAMLNTFFARYELTADSLGGGYVHGKAFLMPVAMLVPRDGRLPLESEVAEDAAATRLVRAQGLKVRLTRRPFEQPLGRRLFAEVWHRNLRWAQLRKRAYPIPFLLEPAMTILPVLALVVPVARAMEAPILVLLMLTALVWYGSEALLARLATWPWSARFFVAVVIRDALALAIWLVAWFRMRYAWRGEVVELDSDAGHEAR